MAFKVFAHHLPLSLLGFHQECAGLRLPLRRKVSTWEVRPHPGMALGLLLFPEFLYFFIFFFSLHTPLILYIYSINPITINIVWLPLYCYASSLVKRALHIYIYMHAYMYMYISLRDQMTNINPWFLYLIERCIYLTWRGVLILHGEVYLSYMERYIYLTFLFKCPCCKVLYL